MDQDSDRLLSVAGRIVEGSAVSWDDEQRQATDEESGATLRGLQDLEVILAAQRVIEREYDTTAKRDTEPVAVGVGPSRWRHLVILNKIGEGSFGSVYRAYDSQLAVDVALKLMSPSRTARAKNPDRMLSEARLLARVRHPNVVTVYGADQTEDYVGLWMEFIKGRTLGEQLKAQGTFSAHEAALIGRDLCRAVAAVHQAGVLHGDIKAHNVMRQEGGRTVLMDFGAGRPLIDDNAPGGLRNVEGTPMYLAPEVLDGHAPTTASDIYSLGVLLFHLVTGTYPVSGHSFAEIVELHKRGERRRLRDVRADLPDDFVRIVEQATAIDPARRFATAGAFEEALVRMTSPIPSASAHSVGPAKAPFLAIPRWVMLLAISVIAVGGATAVWRERASNPTPASTRVAETTRPSASSAVDSPVVSAYEIDAAFYRVGRNGEEQLESGARLAPGDELFLKFQASVPIHLYVVNEDDNGESFLEFPLRGQRQTNPIQAGQQVTLPGTTTRWRVTTAGGREHFLVFASPDRLESFEQAFAALPSPQENAPVVTARLEPKTIEQLRSVGGLTQDASKQNAGTGLWRLFTTPLTNARESTRGLWVRQITLDNPER
jgi:eukaryotic-like serine/threonine-protein kinase